MNQPKQTAASLKVSLLREDERRLGELARNASTPPWIADTQDHLGENWLICSFGNSTADGKDYIVTTDHVHCSEFSGDAKDDADFVSAARLGVPLLLERLTAERANLSHAVRCMDRSCSRCNELMKSLPVEG